MIIVYLTCCLIVVVYDSWKEIIENEEMTLGDLCYAVVFVIFSPVVAPLNVIYFLMERADCIIWSKKK
jgi:hypothetical protein